MRAEAGGTAERSLINPVDNAWLQMDQPGNPMVIGALFQLDGPVDAAAFQRELVERLLRYPRFRQVADRRASPPCWVDSDDLDFRYHVQVRRLPAEGFERHLRKLISEEISRDLNPERPLWRLLLCPRAGGPITVLFRAHHALADGIALVTLLVDSTDARLLRNTQPPPQSTRRPPHEGPLGGLIDRLEMLNQGLGRFAGGELGQPRQLLRRVREGGATLGAIRRLLKLPDDRPSAMGRPLSGQRGVAWIDGLPFAPVRRQAHRLDVRVHDILMAALAGAFRQQLSNGDEPPPPDQNLRVSIPVNLRRSRGRELGNQFGLVLLDLPVGVEDPAERLRVVAQRMVELKSSLQARIVLLGLAAAGHLPGALEKRLVGVIGSRAVAVVSNLPGPGHHVHIAGAKMKKLVFWPPQAGGMGIGLSLFTYAGGLSAGISADRALLPNPQLLLNAFAEELEQIGRLHTLQVEPEPEPAAAAPRRRQAV